ncbi:translation initiation factor IF-2, partial [Oleidesulfovibrio alaskensis]
AAGFGQPAQAENSSPFADGQSKKKRQKGRRTVEFGDKGAGGKKMREDVGGNWNRGKKGKRKPETKPVSTQPQRAAKRKIKVDEAIRVSDFAHQMGVKAPEIIKILMSLGIMATINQSLDIDTATVVAAEFGYEVEKVGFSEDEFLLPKEVDAEELLLPRPPVVTIMGHVDHGKTSLLDAIRKSSVTTGEAGGITQHIGAYHVSTKRGDIVFLDTPGHEAFTAMRARGAQVTDLVILVVAADDGVMEQTREAISHAKAAGVPIVVAVNKIDKEGANRDRVMRELAEQDLVPEEWGGDTIFSYVSAKTREGLDDLLEMLALQAEVLELKANPDKPARGRIVEAKLDKGRGAVGTVLIQEGTLKHGDAFVCGVFSGRVRAMFNDQGKKAKQAGPSIPVEVQGFEGVPVAGEEFICVKDEKVARRIAEQRAIKQRERDLARESKVTLETFLARRKTDAETQTLNLVLKADVQGSVGAITDALRKMQTEKVKVDIIHSGAGAITESDILLASASDAIIIGFNVRPTAKVKDVAEQEKVEIRFYDIIYKLSEEIKSAMAGLLAPVVREQYLGQAEVRETFSVPKVGTVAGCHVADGKIIRNTKVRLLRDGVVIYTGRINSLKRFKDDVKEVAKGFECGMGLENYNDIKIGDIIEAFEEVEEAATLD